MAGFLIQPRPVRMVLRTIPNPKLSSTQRTRKIKKYEKTSKKSTTRTSSLLVGIKKRQLIPLYCETQRQKFRRHNPNKKITLSSMIQKFSSGGIRLEKIISLDTSRFAQRSACISILLSKDPVNKKCMYDKSDQDGSLPQRKWQMVEKSWFFLF